jgi:hypothetical protein
VTKSAVKTNAGHHRDVTSANSEGKELKRQREVIISVWVSVQTKSVQVGAERDPPSSGSGETYPALAGGSRLDSIAKYYVPLNTNSLVIYII